MSAQLEDGYTRIANEILERVYKSKFNGTQSSILLFVLRNTYGFQRKHRDMSLNYIANGIDTHKDQVKRELDKLIERGVIKVFEEASFSKPRVIGLNKDCGTWDLQANEKSPLSAKTSTVDENAYQQSANKSTPTVDELAHQRKKDIKETLKERVLSVFEFYKSKNIVNHRKLEGALEQQIQWKLAKYAADELKECISNYAEILHSDEYILDTKWGLDVFLMNHFEKFLTERDPFSYYPKRKSSTSISIQSAKYSNRVPMYYEIDDERNYPPLAEVQK